MTKRLYIETVGCQMNFLDSEMVVASLRQKDFELTTDPQLADVMLFNTCSVRQHAEDKTYSSLGRMRLTKQSHPEKIIGVMGCMAQKEQARIFERAPYVDLVVGPGQLHQIPELIEQARIQGERQVAVSLGRRDGGWRKSNAVTRRSIRCAIPRCGLHRTRLICESKSAATSSAPIAWCP